MHAVDQSGQHDETGLLQVLKQPPSAHFLLAAAGIADGSARAGAAETPVGAVSLKHIYEIAKVRALLSSTARR